MHGRIDPARLPNALAKIVPRAANAQPLERDDPEYHAAEEKGNTGEGADGPGVVGISSEFPNCRQRVWFVIGSQKRSAVG
jgi:hypothetical protein